MYFVNNLMGRTIQIVHIEEKLRFSVCGRHKDAFDRYVDQSDVDQGFYLEFDKNNSFGPIRDFEEPVEFTKCEKCFSSLDEEAEKS